MEFREWMSENDLTQEAAAEELGVCQQMVCRVASKKHPVSLGLSLRIQLVTEGEVKATDLALTMESRRSLRVIRSLVQRGAFE